MRELAYGADHPKAVMDTPQSVEAVSREDFLRWHDCIFSRNLSGAELFLSGRVTPPMIDGINRIFGSVAVDTDSDTSPHILPFDTVAPSFRFIESPGALQSAIRFAIPSIPRTHPDYIMLRCAVVALGGYFGSRLMSNIREDKGYTLSLIHI